MDCFADVESDDFQVLDIDKVFFEHYLKQVGDVFFGSPDEDQAFCHEFGWVYLELLEVFESLTFLVPFDVDKDGFEVVAPSS